MRCALAKTGALRQRRLASSTAGGTSASLPALLMILGLLLACAKAAERFARQEPPLQTARQQQRPLPVAGGGSCCWRRALVFQAAFAAQEKPAQRKRRADLAGPDLLRLTNICGGTCALANIGARRQQRLAVSATGGASALLLGKPGRRPQEKLLPGQFPPEGGCRAAAGGIH